MISAVIEKGIEKIYKDDMDTQKHFIDTVMKEARDSDSRIIFKAKGFFVPNDKYMIKYFGQSVLGSDYDCYDSYGNCHWTGYLVLPIRNVNNLIVGFVGYNPFIAIENKEQGIWDRPYYRHSSKAVMDKSLLLFGLEDYFIRARKEGYIIITDGVFDMLSCEHNGLIAGALLGSYVSQQLAAQLLFIPKVIVAMDNDQAGKSVVSQLKRWVPQTIALKQGKFKDIDSLLNSEYREQAVKMIKDNLNSVDDIILKL